MVNNPLKQPYPPSLASPVSQESIGRQKLLTVDDVEYIIGKTGLPLLDDVAEENFSYWLNNSVDWTIREQLTARLNQEQVDTVSEILVAHRELSNRFLYSEYPPPGLPRAWAEEAKKWVADAQSIVDRRIEGGAPPNAEKWVFYPRAIGLFHAAFGADPDAVVSRNGNGRRGAVFRFLSAIRDTTNKRISERSMSSAVPRDLEALAQWHPVEDEAFRKRLKDAVKVRMRLGPVRGNVEYFPVSGRMQPHVAEFEGPAWKIFSEEFKDVLAGT